MRQSIRCQILNDKNWPEPVSKPFLNAFCIFSFLMVLLLTSKNYTNLEIIFGLKDENVTRPLNDLCRSQCGLHMWRIESSPLFRIQCSWK